MEAVLLKMVKGETATVEVKSPYAYGHVGDELLAVPGGADLTYSLTLEDFEQVLLRKVTVLLGFRSLNLYGQS